MEGGKSLQAFTAAGRVQDEVPYQVEQSKDFRPFRRKTEYFKSKDASIHPHWGHQPAVLLQGVTQYILLGMPRAFHEEVAASLA